MRLYLLLLLPSGAVCLSQLRIRMDDANPLSARRTPIGDGFGFVNRAAPAPTTPPRVRFRNALLERQASENTCGFLVNSAERICRTGTLGPGTRCCTASTSGWQPQCVNWRMENPDGEMTYMGCYNTLLSGLNTNSIFLVTDTSLLPWLLPPPSTTEISPSTDSTSSPTDSAESTPETTSTGLPDSTVSFSLAAPSESDGSAPVGPPVGAIIGGIVGGIAVIALIVFAVVWFTMYRKRPSRNNGMRPPTAPHKQPGIVVQVHPVPSPTLHQKSQPQAQKQRHGQDQKSKVSYQQHPLALSSKPPA
ncbi:hypothetical protein CKAH01_02036 [Colletotrichum kahawae]|uniref:Uncharacterized protein n=1 Tax=Colletotrichum kahawae TaxID=34407 RepID=A0AAE0CZL4_COLKA|nr:hypothetical protein CKAH01_02036 [Colletotrichum kahawae]